MQCLWMKECYEFFHRAELIQTLSPSRTAVTWPCSLITQRLLDRGRLSQVACHGNDVRVSCLPLKALCVSSCELHTAWISAASIKQVFKFSVGSRWGVHATTRMQPEFKDAPWPFRGDLSFKAVLSETKLQCLHVNLSLLQSGGSVGSGGCVRVDLDH